MDPVIKKMQKRVLTLFSKEAKDFALAGGTALELYYLHHRFSWDLDFFSRRYNIAEIEGLVSAIKKKIDKRIRLESELMAAGRAKVRFYSLPVKGASRPLKIHFIEDVLIEKPNIKRKDGARVYSEKNIYLQKIAAIAGTQAGMDITGRPIQQGRNEARDAFDLYKLSTQIRPLHQFLHEAAVSYQKGMVHWYRTFSRQDLKLALLDMDIYDPRFDSREMIAHLESEMKLFARGVIEG